MRACRTRPFSISHMMSVSRSADIRFRNLDLRPRSIFRMSVRIESDCIKPRKPPRCAPVMPATARILRAKVQPYRVQHRRSCMRCVARAGARAALGRRAPHASTRASTARRPSRAAHAPATRPTPSDRRASARSALAVRSLGVSSRRLAARIPRVSPSCKRRSQTSRPCGAWPTRAPTNLLTRHVWYPSQSYPYCRYAQSVENIQPEGMLERSETLVVHSHDIGRYDGMIT